ncbi:hypothetical protein JCM19239_5075 [Vibrio variabilis]|uniref:ABM domain-containing protein n=1 Tax=Vibrio variabilis TaxID=990271 RepID=A0ABQ0J8T8_9VIBR|nr:hypothetical protein JCM19239_5075 [Vibrio variabilis]
MKQITMLGLLTASLFSVSANAEVIEIATFKLNEGVSVEEFAPLDKAVEMQHVSQQPGFISREAAHGENGEWLVVVHWETIEDADASMNSFMTAEAAKEFMSHLDANTMSMKRYTK